MNNVFLQDLVKGRYGRKIAYTDVEEINESNIVKVVGKAIGIHNYNKTVIKYLWDYKNGDQPTRYRIKTIRDDVCNVVIENHAFEIVAFKNAQTNGEPIQYVSTQKDEKVSKAVDLLNEFARVSRKQRRDIDAGEWTSAVGTGYKAVCRTSKDDVVPFMITAPTPMNTFIIYSRSTDEPMLAIQELKDENGERYLLCFDKRFEYRIKNSSLVTLDYDADGVAITKRLHMFADIPIVEYPNNQDRISDIELVIDMLDAINNLQSNRTDAVEQFVQSFFKFVNCDIDPETFAEMKKYGALSVKSNNGENKADVDIISQELNQSETQVYKEDLWNNILTILAIPNKQGGTGGDSQGAVELRNGWDFAKSRAKLKDTYTIDAEMRLAKVMLGVIHWAKGSNVCDISEMDFVAQVTHSPTDNLIVKTNALSLLLQSGVAPKIAIETCGLWSDAEKVYLQSKETIDKKQYAESQEQVNIDKTVVEE